MISTTNKSILFVYRSQIRGRDPPFPASTEMYLIPMVDPIDEIPLHDSSSVERRHGIP